jgi:anti-sigma factor (TIGR02949 family)
MTCDEVKPLLSARMDGEIDSAQRAAVDSHVELCSSCAADLEKLDNVRYAIRTEMRQYKAPADLRGRVRTALGGAEYLDRRARYTGWRVWGAVAATVALCALAATPFLINVRDRSQLTAKEFLSAHQRALIGRSVDVISSDQHTVKPWFNGKLPFSPPVTDLASDGFPLEGGRVDYAGERPVAALVYGRRLHKIDVFVRPSDGENAPPSHFESNGYNEISWEKDNFSFTAVSDLNRAELAGFANLLRAR